MSDALGLENIHVISAVFKDTPSIQKAVVFGSRAKGNYKKNSDVDIALYGDIIPSETEKVKCDLEELPFIYKFDVVAYNSVKNEALREHIDRVGVVIYEKGGGNEI
ncbi:MAG: nucleotidyltransferase domain-containing protein [Methanimicrococcus sp.]|nr:nucleotidyltransferase domain-containing protein [Methanimicrococcus sp.]